MLMVWLHPEPGRSLGLGPRMLLLIVYVKHLVVPFLGLFAARQASAQVVSDVANGVTPWLAYAVTVAAAAAIAAGVVLARRREVAWLFVAAVAIMALSYFGALGPHTALIGPDFGMRYAYVPCVLFGLTLLGIATNTRRVARTIATMLVAWLIVVGLASYFVPSRQFASGPAWGDEVAKWRADPGYAIQLWPAVRSWKRELGPPPGINGRPD